MRATTAEEFTAVRAEIRAGDEETPHQMRVLHEDLVGRIVLQIPSPVRLKPDSTYQGTSLATLARCRRRGALPLEHVRHVTLSLLEVRNPVGHPIGCRLPEQEVIEELVHVHG